VIGDPFLNYFALGLLFFVAIVLFYGIIAIHDIPHIIAKGRNHPHQDAIHAAGWVSLFTLHVLWPFLWIWAMAYRPECGWGSPTNLRRSLMMRLLMNSRICSWCLCSGRDLPRALASRFSHSACAAEDAQLAELHLYRRSLRPAASPK
jgi:hypothetical protein